jgi:AraC-like DNA-binding protein
VVSLIAGPTSHPARNFDAESFSEWQDRMSSRFVRLEVTTDRPECFHGSIRSREYGGGILLSHITAGAQRVDRPLGFIDPFETRFYKFSLQLSGTGIIVQDGREATVTPGDMCIYDTSRPYTLIMNDDVENLVLIFPHELLRLPSKAVAQLTGVRIGSESAMSHLVGPFIRQLGQKLEDFNENNAMRLAHNTLDLIATLLHAELDLDNPLKQGRDLDLMTKVQEYIERNLGSYELTPTVIADANYISTRRLHYLFRSEGTTVTGWIKQRRLEQCRRDLSDPALWRETVTTISRRWGFSESAHFSRAFRAAFGISPREYRRRSTTKTTTPPVF